MRQGSRPVIFGVLINLLVLGCIACAQETYTLAPASVESGRMRRVEANLQVGGDVSLKQPDQVRKLPMNVAARLRYDEMLLPAPKLRSNSPRSLRYYDHVDATIQIDRGGQQPTLALDHRLIAVYRTGAKTTLLCPSGLLTREELDLVDLPGNGLVLDDLLPAEPVMVGATWQQKEQTLAALLGLDAVSLAEVHSSLVEVKDEVAKMALSGTVHGAVAGVGTEIELKGKYSFDLKQREITWFAMAIKEKRSIGHVGPGLDVVAKLTMAITPIEQSEHLDPAAIAKLPKAPSAELSRLVCHPAGGKIGLEYDRRWYVTSEDANLSVMRLVDQGELVAQCNISPLPDTTPQKQGTLEEFQADVEKSLGKNFGQLEKAGQWGESGVRVLRVVARGDVSDVHIQWIYYLLTDSQGHRATVAFTLEQDLAERFGDADRQLVKGLRFVVPTSENDSAEGLKAAERPSKRQ